MRGAAGSCSAGCRPSPGPRRRPWRGRATQTRIGSSPEREGSSARSQTEQEWMSKAALAVPRASLRFMADVLRIVHLLAAAVWLGGTVALVFAGVPAIRTLQG